MRLSILFVLMFGLIGLFGQPLQEELHQFNLNLIEEIKTEKNFSDFYPKLNDYLAFVDNQPFPSDQKNRLKQDAVKKYTSYQKDFVFGAKEWADYVEELFGEETDIVLASESHIPQKDGSISVEFFLTNDSNSVEERFQYTAIFINNQLKIIDGFYY